MRIQWFANHRVVLLLTVASVWLGCAALFSTAASPAASSPVAQVGLDPDICCVTGDCCCPPACLSCDPSARAKTRAGTKTVRRGPGCCATGLCCCPGASSCCAPEGKRPAVDQAPAKTLPCCLK